VVGASGQGPGSEGSRGPGWQPPFELLESKLHPPRSGRGIVPRTALLERLLTVPAARLVCVAAPSGYGKTTLLAQWAERRRGRRAWVTLDRHDNDPVVLLRYLAVALDRVDPIDSELRGFLESPGAAVPASLISRFVAGLSSLRHPVTVVLDNLELLVNQVCLDAVAEVGLRLPAGSGVALASRARLSLPSALTDPAGQLVEVGARDLAMDEGEVRAVLERAGVRLSDAEVADLLERTEGWPVGVYLASSAVAGEGRHAARTATSGNGEVPAGQVAAGEPPADLLGRLSPPTVAFLTRTAVLDELSGPLCDAVLQMRGSDRVLESLAGSNLLLVELEHRDRRYRYHQFLRELLLAELERREPELVDELHRRAAAWYEDEGRPELAVDHGQAAGDGDRVARLVAGLAFGAYAGGRVQTARGWFRWFEDQGLVERYPRIAMLGAQLETLLGNASTAERWAAVAERGLGRAEADATMDASMALLRTMLCRDGMAAMRADASAAWDGLDPDSPWRPTALLMEGISHLLDGQADLADPILARAVEIAEEYGATPAASAALGERAVIAMERQQWDEAGRLSDRALAALRAGRLHDYAMAAFVHAVAARAVLHQGDGGRAREHLRRATNLRPLLTSAMPHRSVQTLAEMARAYLALDDVAGARAVLRQAGEIIRQRPSLGVLPGQVGGLKTAADELGQGMGGASSLTAAELRLLPLLSTHLSLLEIGERLHLSRNTVKTHAVSIYRKLGVSSRSEAMQRVRELGLLER
jgi:LuxR family transcriptional regulator, maltose regulon positive regulatory protein